ncbi:uncharacterized protein LOC111053290 isoform X2 [Nilaparvata lugens]|uniref:uncharacterized protein LOC111053290 isoform X2 n=1 Tax=Nilaparvata lugens TaxID=108931 RepID=UPI00193DA9A5|nr:uncharacterized protein LOC111053290 isoform X2 [Nilaparvata lugens]
MAYSTKVQIIFVWIFLGGICCLINCPVNSALNLPCFGISPESSREATTKKQIADGKITTKTTVIREHFENRNLYILYIAYNSGANLDLGCGEISPIVCYEQKDSEEIQDAIKADERVSFMKKIYDESSPNKKKIVNLNIDPLIEVSNCFSLNNKPYLFQRVKRVYKLDAAVTEVTYPLGYPFIEFKTFDPKDSFEFCITSFVHSFGRQEVQFDKDVCIYNVGSDFEKKLFAGESTLSRSSVELEKQSSLYSSTGKCTNSGADESETMNGPAKSKPSLIKRITKKASRARNNNVKNP